jgi:hypothetical protein
MRDYDKIIVGSKAEYETLTQVAEAGGAPVTGPAPFRKPRKESSIA